MKTKIIMPIIAVSFLLAHCKSEKSSIEIVPNYDEIYFDAERVDIPAKEIKDNEVNEMIKKIGASLKERVGAKITKAAVYKFAIKLYLNEDGKIDKVRFDNPSKFDFTIDTSNSVIFKSDNDVRQKILSVLENYRFKPAVKSGVNVKFSKDLVFVVKLFTDGSVKEYFPDLAAQYNEKDYLFAAEQMPSPIGGIAEIAKKIVYPEAAKQAGIEGKVFVKAYVDEKGNVVKAEIIKGIGYGCDEAAINAVNNTKFTPGVKDGKPVKTQVAVPILFKIK
ncbi:energy transducer TonB [Melioribacteraceae bacterium 4301-Me]|uniref:energy transducer TonB n=1 Tax=Pyranulibacter aquaticus TaxID=3163344 RepID=UPI0035997743